MYCKNCGSELNESVKFCENCGTKVNEDFTTVVQSVVKNATDKVKENEFVKSVKQDIENSQSLNIIKDKAKEGFNSAVDKAKEASQNFKAMDSEEKKNSIINNIKKTLNDLSKVKTISVIASILLTLTLFLPMVKLYGEALTMKELFRMIDSSMESAIGFVGFLYAITIIWAMIPKKWAAIVGAVNALLPILISFAFIIDCVSESAYRLGFGGFLMALLSILVFVLSVVKLIILLREKRKNRINDDMNQPSDIVM